jgi:hypothetical protein
MKRALLAAVAALLGSGVACDAFSDLPDEQACHDIPKGGCPAPEESDGNPRANCIDPTCAALYACDGDGHWSLVATCPARDAGTSDARPMADARPEAGERRDVAFVPPGASGGPGCTELESPDCPLSIALDCRPTQCCSCQDLYVCADGGWDLWGECEDGGTIVKGGGLSSP